VKEENKTALTHADIANRQDQNTRIKTTQRLPSAVPSEEKDKTSCYELGVQKEALGELLKNQRLSMSMLNETIAGLEKRVANITNQFLTTEMELKMSQEKITNTEALNTQCQSENNFLKKQKSDLVVQWSKSNSSFTKKINEYALLERNNKHNLAQINMNQNTIKLLEADLAEEREKYSACLKNLSISEKHIHTHFLRVITANETVSNTQNELHECASKNVRFTTQLQECKNSVEQARIDSEDIRREFKTVSLHSTILFANFSEQMETARQKVTACRLAFDEKEHELKRTQLLFKNVSAQYEHVNQQLVIVNTELAKTEIKFGTLSQECKDKDFNLTNLQTAFKNIEQELRVSSDACAHEKLCQNELLRCQNKQTKTEDDRLTLSKQFEELNNNLSALQLGHTNIKQNLTQLAADRENRFDLCSQQLLLCNAERTRAEITLTKQTVTMQTLETTISAQQLAKATSDSELIRTRRLFSDELKECEQKLMSAEKNISQTFAINKQKMIRLNKQLNEYQTNATGLQRSLNTSVQEINSCLENLLSLATEHEITKRNISASLTLANQQLNLSTSHIQTLNRNNQRLHSETEQMIQRHELEKINFQQKIDALTTLLMAEPSNVYRYYYFMPVLISYLKNISINCHCFLHHQQ
jgi:chromosome segregation ATPase